MPTYQFIKSSAASKFVRFATPGVDDRWSADVSLISPSYLCFLSLIFSLFFWREDGGGALSGDQEQEAY